MYRGNVTESLGTTKKAFKKTSHSYAHFRQKKGKHENGIAARTEYWWIKP